MLLDAEMVVPWVAAGASLVLVLWLVFQRKNRVEERLGDLSTADPGSRGRIAGKQPPTPTSLEDSLDRQAARSLKKQAKKNDLNERMAQAGLYHSSIIGAFFALRALLLIAPAGLGLLAGSMGLVSLTNGLLLGAIAGLGGTLAPVFWLDHLKRSRQTKIRRALPDALDIMVVCLEGGISLQGSFSRVARELSTAHPMLAVEFRIVERQTQMGQSTSEALRTFAQRFDLEELRSMASVVSQTEQIGASVVRALSVFADTLRLKRHQRAEEMAHKASVKLLFPTLLFIFPAIFIVILGPAAIQIYQQLIEGVFRNVAY